MIIYLEKLTDHLTDAEIQTACDAMNVQISKHFAPVWSCSATVQVRTLPLRGVPPGSAATDINTAADAIVYVQDKLDVEGAVGYHDINNKDVPYGVVSKEISDEIGEPWTVTLSHEVLELLLDPWANLTVMGPNPKWPKHAVFHNYEVADAVQAQDYKIGDIYVSNFLLPLYFVVNGYKLGPTNYLKEPLTSFGVAPGGYIAYYDPRIGKYVQMLGKNAEARQAAKLRMGPLLRRFLKYQNQMDQFGWWKRVGNLLARG